MRLPITEPLPGLPGHLGITLHEVGPEQVIATLHIDKTHLAPTGYLHGATVVALADTACGYGCLASLPEGKKGFTTIELKTNHLATATVGQTIRATATPLHRGRTTQVWDAQVTINASGYQHVGRPIAAFRCTQMLLDHETTASSASAGPGLKPGQETRR